ncbi:transketolase [Hydrogenispora ethanolica]|uniref:Transketolase n=1 Tax=Hydrogenispora ethanolica TaxID=1082276 RepID=A0A4V2QCM4_HYDET|nr:transketolase C-terminal domain-containing protein [Hydrogenispora ethanolica]TCL60867.1 transketolase [Hydrogenispora ethanolica]
MPTAANRQVFAETLLELARNDPDIIALACDSRGSASLDRFADELPEQFVEVGIAEQNLVGIAAGLASCGKKPFACSPACFLTMRSVEQIKVDVAYSHQNVKLVGISGGVSYGALGATHHSLQDIAVMQAIPDLTVIIPSDNRETAHLTRLLAGYDRPVYLRTGRGPVPDVHDGAFVPEIGKGCLLLPGTDLTIVTTGEVVRIALDAGEILHQRGISARIIEIHTIKPLDERIVLQAAQETQALIVMEEHSIYGGLGCSIAALLGRCRPRPLQIMAIPDEFAVVGNQREIWEHYGLTAATLAQKAEELLRSTKASA